MHHRGDADRAAAAAGSVLDDKVLADFLPTKPSTRLAIRSLVVPATKGLTTMIDRAGHCCWAMAAAPITIAAIPANAAPSA